MSEVTPLAPSEASDPTCGNQPTKEGMELEQRNEKQNGEFNSSNVDNSDNVIIREEELTNGTGYEDKTNYDSFNVRREGYFFADEIKVDGETIFTIPFEKQVEDMREAPKRKSRWGDRPQRRKKAPVNLVFNPLQGMETGNGMLAITADGYKPGDKISLSQQEEDEEKFSRWGPEYEKTFHPPLLNYIPHSVNDDDLEYIIRLYRLDEIQNKMMNKIKTVFDDEDCRSPSPEPIYDGQGRRINTRDYREEESLQTERQNLIEESVRINPTFIPPHDYKVTKKQKKIYLPEQNAELLKQKVIGQKGATHKKLEADSGCKISIKGKGSTNGLKRVENDANEKLHILIMGSTDEQLEKATSLIDEILRGEEKTDPTGPNTIALIDGIIFSNFCSKCHQPGHPDWKCTNKAAFDKVELKCDICGDKGHITSDCKFKKEFAMRQQQMGYQMPQTDVRLQFENFINDVEGSKKLLTSTGYGFPVPPRQQQITATSFITDEVTIDPNQLMILSSDRNFDQKIDGTTGQLPAYAANATYKDPRATVDSRNQANSAARPATQTGFGETYPQAYTTQGYYPYQNQGYFPQAGYPYYQGGYYPHPAAYGMYQQQWSQMYPQLNTYPHPAAPAQTNQTKPPHS